MAKYNMLTKNVKGAEYLVTDFIATSLSKSKFERLKELNPELLGDYNFVAYRDTDSTWWMSCSKYLSETGLYDDCLFDCDCYGDITKY